MKPVALSLASVLLLTGCSSLIGEESDAAACEKLATVLSAENVSIETFLPTEVAAKLRAEVSPIAAGTLATRVDDLAAALEGAEVDVAGAGAAASEIGVAAARQGFNIGVPTAEQLAAQGITQAEAQRGYATIADILPTATKLSDIYGNVLEGYGLAEGEQEVFNQLASAQRKRVALSQREIASFQGSSGMSRVSLQSGETKGQF